MSDEEIKAHKMTQIPKYILIGVLIIGAIWIFSGNIFNFSSNCENSQSEYQNGNASGNMIRVTGGSCSCNEYVNSYNYETGRNTKHTTDCFCEGFEDGLNGRPSKY
ncbi:MAG: hypothetical protein RBS77_05510 [Candidatus Moranbacteria bacterium]|jgi:hypothetical protein|nr:hypothetical protein [Candidatus Moranbacteria bacterium]